MAKKYRVGVAGLVHDHVWGELGRWKQLDNVELVAASDVNPPLLNKVKEQHGIENLYSSWQKMLDVEQLDIVQVMSENNVGADIVEAAAAKGVHVVSEKPMAARLPQAERMIKAAEEAGILLMINWPTAWSPVTNTIAKLIREEEVGRIFYFKSRSAHAGPKEIGCSTYFWKWLYDEDKNGAGALMDFCCYAADMCAYFLGLPKSVIGMRGVLTKDYSVPDDNAIILMKYDNAFGVAEASWSQYGGSGIANPIVYGTEGSICVIDGKIIIEKKGQSARTLEPEPLPQGKSTGPEYLINCIETGEPIEGMCSPKVGRDAQEILEAGYISANIGKEVKLPLQ